MHRETRSLTAKNMRRGGNRHQQAKSTTDGLWSRLPDELLERALLYLPLPDLCRFRSVCKSWNALICTPEFGALRFQNASKGGSTGASLVVQLRAYNPLTTLHTEIQSWSVFDLNARRWYNVKHKLPKAHDFGCRTMDGGLICTFVNAFTDTQRQTSTILGKSHPQILIISNILGGTIKVLPKPPLVGYIHILHLNLKLVVDNKSHTYKVFLRCMDRFHNASMCVYESSTNRWRFTATPTNSLPSDLYEIYDPHSSSAWFQGVLYVLFRRLSNCLCQLYSYNFLEDSWEDTGVKYCKGESDYRRDICEMVVSDNRLFLLTQHWVDPCLRKSKMCKEPGQFASPLDVSEISLADKALRTVVRLKPAEVYQNFSIEQDMPREWNFKIRAFGYDKSILLMCRETGKVIEYNLVTGLWEALPPNPVESLHLQSIPQSSPRYLYRFGNLMGGFLRLPNTSWG